MECRLHRTLDRSNEEREGSRVLTWSLMGTDKEVALLLTERRTQQEESNLLNLKCLWAFFWIKKKLFGKEAKGSIGLKINYETWDGAVSLESPACRIKPWESVK